MRELLALEVPDGVAGLGLHVSYAQCGACQREEHTVERQEDADDARYRPDGSQAISVTP